MMYTKDLRVDDTIGYLLLQGFEETGVLNDEETTLTLLIPKDRLGQLILQLE